MKIFVLYKKYIADTMSAWIHLFNSIDLVL